MDRDTTDKESGNVEFEDNQQSSAPMMFTPLDEENRKNLAEFYSPLFHRNFSRNNIYWVVFLFVSIFWTTKIFLSARAFAEEISVYQISMLEDNPHYENRTKKTPVLPLEEPGTSSFENKNKKR